MNHNKAAAVLVLVMALSATAFGKVKWGFVDTTGREIVKPRYEDVGCFFEGRAWVKSGGKYGFIDRNGKEVIPVQYSEWGNFSEGLAAIKVDDKYGFIDTTGRIVIAPTFGYAGSFSEGLAEAGSRRRRGFIDHSGRFVIDTLFPDVGRFSQGLASFDTFGSIQSTELMRGCGYMDRTGKIVVGPYFGDPHEFSCGWAKVGADSGFGGWDSGYRYLDRGLKRQHRAAFDDEDFKEGLAVIRRTVRSPGGNRYIASFADTSFHNAFKQVFKYASGFSEGLAAVTVQGREKFGYIDKTGTVVITDRFDDAGDFHSGRALVTDGKCRYYIDRTGKRMGLVEEKKSFLGYDDYRHFSEGFAAVARGTKEQKTDEEDDDGW
jgi:hypothetical protein